VNVLSILAIMVVGTVCLFLLLFGVALVVWAVRGEQADEVAFSYGEDGTP
jgi:nitrogen fixation-related uncharacterized protein